MVEENITTTALMPRRRFLRNAAGALAAGGTLAASTRCVEGRAAPSDRITIGMIGMGRQAASINVKAFLNAPDTQVVAVCDVDAWRLARGQQIVERHYAESSRTGKFLGCEAYQDFRVLLARQDIDAVMISTPDHWHVPIAIAAARAGKDICCEKPLARSIAEGRLLSDVVARYQRVFRTDSEARFKTSFHRAAELAQNGAVGRIHTIHVAVPSDHARCGQPPEMSVPEELNYDMWLGPAPEAPYTENRVHPRQDYGRGGWMRVRDYCDGMITNWGAHLVDIAQWGNGSDRTGPVEIEATGHYPQDDLWNVLEKFAVRYRFANGTEMTLRDDQREFVRFEGEDGWVEAGFSPKSLQSSDPSILELPARKLKVFLARKDEKRDFIDCIKTRSQTLCDAEVGHRTTSVCLLGQIAVKMGTRLRWDPGAERFLDNPEANRLLSRPMREPWSLEGASFDP